MVGFGESKHAEKWSQQAMQRLAADGMLPTPRHYTVYYHYFSGETPGLVTEFEVATRAAPMTPEKCADIYSKYFIADTDAALLKSISGTIDTELKKVMELITVSTQGTDQFGEKLDTFSGKLKGADSIEMLREAVQKIAVETRHITAENRKLHTELEVASHQLVEMRENFETAHKESQIDPLTEVGNRKYFDREVRRVIAEARDQNIVLSLLMVDIDHFKKFNDNHGHLVGDQVLRLVARTLVENLKGRDIIARYGGEEFVILLPQTRLADAERVANQLRASLATKQVRKRGSHEVLGVITISLGAAEYVAGEDSDQLIGRADKAMYEAKQTGRNKVVCLAAESA